MRILVTGGGGFLGQALCCGLVERGHEVTSFNRGHYPELDALGVEVYTSRPMPCARQASSTFCVPTTLARW